MRKPPKPEEKRLFLSPLIDEYLGSNPHWTAKSRCRVETHLRITLAILGNRDIQSLRKQDFRVMRAKLPQVSAHATKRGKPILGGSPPYLSTKSLNDLIGYVRTFWRWLELSYDEIETNPTVALVPFKQAEETTRDAISDDDLAKWLSIASGQSRLLISTLALTGLRLGELAGLTASEVDTANRCLKIQSNAIRRLKTPSSNRLVPLHPSIDIEALKASLPFSRTETGIALISKLLCRELRGKVTSDERVTAHSLRHWHATKLKELGCEDSLVADCLGHKLGTMTSRYAKPSSLERKREWVNRLTLPVLLAPSTQVSLPDISNSINELRGREAA